MTHSRIAGNFWTALAGMALMCTACTSNTVNGSWEGTTPQGKHIRMYFGEQQEVRLEGDTTALGRIPAHERLKYWSTFDTVPSQLDILCFKSDDKDKPSARIKGLVYFDNSTTMRYAVYPDSNRVRPEKFFDKFTTVLHKVGNK